MARGCMAWPGRVPQSGMSTHQACRQQVHQWGRARASAAGAGARQHACGDSNSASLSTSAVASHMCMHTCHGRMAIAMPVTAPALTRCRAPRPPRSQTVPARWTRRPRPSETSHPPRTPCLPAHDRTGRSTCGQAVGGTGARASAERRRRRHGGGTRRQWWDRPGPSPPPQGAVSANCCSM